MLLSSRFKHNINVGCDWLLRHLPSPIYLGIMFILDSSAFSHACHSRTAISNYLLPTLVVWLPNLNYTFTTVNLAQPPSLPNSYHTSTTPLPWVDMVEMYVNYLKKTNSGIKHSKTVQNRPVSPFCQVTGLHFPALSVQTPCEIHCFSKEMNRRSMFGQAVPSHSLTYLIIRSFLLTQSSLLSSCFFIMYSLGPSMFLSCTLSLIHIADQSQ